MHGTIMSDPYEILGVSKDADDGEIKKAFRKRSLDLHPDRNTERDTTNEFQELNAAFDQVKTAELRQKHEMESQFGHHSMPPHGFGGGGGGGAEFHDINHVFNMMFGGGGGMGGMGGGMGGPGVRIFHGGMPGGMPGGIPGGFPAHFFHQQMQKPPPIIKNVEITMEQCYNGCSIPVEIDRWVIENNTRGIQKDMMNITLPPGINDNEVIVLRDMGNAVDSQTRGDIKLTITLKPHALFQRQGLDLLYKKELTLKEALCGFHFDVPHLNGKMLAMNNTANVTVIHPNFRRTIPQLGFKRDNAEGNLVIEFSIDFPRTLTPAQIEKLKEIL